MKCVATPDFLSKLRALKSVPRLAALASRITRALALADESDLLTGTIPFPALALEGGIIAIGSDHLRFFVVPTDGPDGRYLALLDLVTHRSRQSSAQPFSFGDSQTFFSPRDPKTNSSVNPRVNSAINPRVNSAINPRVNSAINPRVNSAINYRVNSAINPGVNSAVNPRINSTLNPRINSSYGGPFTYDLDLRQTSIIVRASDNVLLRFSSNLDFEGICALDQSGGYAVFDLQNDWIEHWVDDGQGGFVRFALDGEWIGFVT